MVTMSNFIQFQQPLRRIDPDLLVRDVDVNADVNRQRNQDLAARPVDHHPACAGAAFNLRDLADNIAGCRLHRASHELMLVVGARLQRLKRLFRDPQLETGEPFDILDSREAFKADHRPSVLHTERCDREPLVPSRGTRPYGRPFGKSLVDKIRFGIDHDLAAKTMRARDAPDQSHVVPIGDRGLGTGDCCQSTPPSP